MYSQTPGLGRIAMATNGGRTMASYRYQQQQKKKKNRAENHNVKIGGIIIKSIIIHVTSTILKILSIK